MSLAPGTRLGPYEILAPIGAGGMGEVYKARDTKLDRQVAIKVLPSALARDPERLARFEREAKVLASLNHSNIAQIYAIEEVDSIRALVMELVPGQTLKSPVPPDEALRIAGQVADALEAAHDKGVIHRDLKPANIMITPTGAVKVLDFGLAAVTQPAAVIAGDPSQSPTVTMGLSQAGMILGTAGYMSPEQAAGQAVDKRADIWSFGVVLWEMLTGQRLFTGDTAAHIMADVLRAPIDFEKLPATTPLALRTLVKRCLDRDVKTRLRDIGEARITIQNVGKEPEVVANPVAPAPLPLRWMIVTGVLGVVTAVALIVSLIHLRETPPERKRVRFQIAPPENARISDFSISPDGRYLAYVIGEPAVPGRLWLRSLDSLESRVLDGGIGARAPFWSPDGEYIAFFSRGKLNKVAKGGGPPVALCDASIGLGNSNGGAWSTDGVILFSNQGDIFRVSSTGGVPSKVPLRQGSGAPAWLPNGKFLVTNSDGIWIETLDGAQPKRILPDWSNTVYLPPLTGGSPGYLVFLRGDTLMAQPFDGERGEVSGDIVPAADHVGSFGSPYRGAFSASRNGVLVWGRGESVDRELTWVDRTGRRLETVTKPFALRTNPAIALSPDDTKIAIPVAAGNDSDIWIADLIRKTFSRFTFEGSPSAIWSPDGKRILFSSGGGYYLKASDGSGGEELLLKSVPGRGYVYDWSPDGTLISFSQRGAETLFDVWLVSTEGDHKAYPYVQSRFDETWARFSPDGKWMAYSSDESGILQIYAESIPPGKGRWQISTEGGEWAKWRRDGKELFYRQGTKMMAVPVNLMAGAVEAGKPQVLFESNGEARFQVARDGQRFLLTFPAEGASASTPLSIDTNWQAGVKK